MDEERNEELNQEIEKLEDIEEMQEFEEEQEKFLEQEEAKKYRPAKQKYKKEKKHTVLKFLLVLVLLAVLAGVSLFIWYTMSIKAVDKNSSEEIKVKIEIGQGIAEIANTLQENGVINSNISFRIYCKLNKIENLQAGTYSLSPNLSVEEIVSKIKSGDIADSEVKLLFLEGKNMRSVAKTIEANTNHTYSEVMEVFENKEYAKNLISKYWFLTNEILNSDIYYPLEGYLFPNTYIFEDKDVTIDEIVEKMLNETDRVLTKYKTEISQSGYTVHQFLSLASSVECEGSTSYARKGITGVFLKRLEIGMALQSDSTTYYAFKIDMGERDLKTSELNTYNAYNTRGPNMQGKLPVGPISNVGEATIQDVLSPTNTDALFYVTDKNGDIYFTKTNAEHEQIINELKQQGLWYTY